MLKNQQFLTSLCTGSKKLRKQKSIDGHVTSQSIAGRRDFPDYEVLDAMNASALNRLLNTHVHFRKRVSVEEQRSQKNTTDSYEEDTLLT